MIEVDRALARLRERPDKAASHRPAIQRELSQIEARVRHLTDAVARGRGTDVLLDAIEVGRPVRPRGARLAAMSLLNGKWRATRARTSIDVETKLYPAHLFPYAVKM